MCGFLFYMDYNLFFEAVRKEIIGSNYESQFACFDMKTMVTNPKYYFGIIAYVDSQIELDGDEDLHHWGKFMNNLFQLPGSLGFDSYQDSLDALLELDFFCTEDENFNPSVN